MSNTCTQCQSTRLQSAVLANATLEPEKGGAMIKAMTKVEVRASACLECGHVSLSADPSHLKALAAAD